MSSSSAYLTIKSSRLRTSDLLTVLEAKNASYNLDDLMTEGPKEGYGLAKDGYWYIAEQNNEIQAAYTANKVTYLMEQYGRNR